MQAARSIKDYDICTEQLTKICLAIILGGGGPQEGDPTRSLPQILDIFSHLTSQESEQSGDSLQNGTARTAVTLCL